MHRNASWEVDVSFPSKAYCPSVCIPLRSQQKSCNHVLGSTYVLGEYWIRVLDGPSIDFELFEELLLLCRYSADLYQHGN